MEEYHWSSQIASKEPKNQSTENYDDSHMTLWKRKEHQTYLTVWFILATETTAHSR